MKKTNEKKADELLEKIRQGDKKAFHMLEKLAEDGNAQAMSNLAEVYLKGLGGFENSYKKALEYFLKYEAANCRHQNPSHEMSEVDIFLDNLTRAEVFRKVAEIYYSFNDGQKALEYFLKADECGDEWAYISVASIYRGGKGNLKPDGVKLVEYLTKKFEQNEPPDDLILYEIAKAYEEGCGSLEPNMQKAIEFYRKAAALGNDDAEKKLAIRGARDD